MVCMPAEIVEEVLLNLPVKAALRLQCVSKSWRLLIGSKRFIKSHLQKSKKEAVIVHTQSSGSTRNGLGLDWLFKKEQMIRYVKTSEPSSSRHAQIMGCCNGLVCVKVSLEDLFLGNPSTRTFEKLPRIEPASCFGDVGLGWDESRDDYKVFALVMENHYPHNIHARVYSSRTNSWKRLELEHMIPGQIGMSLCGAIEFVRGKFYWYHSRSVGHIRWFDIKTETFGMIESPPPAVDNTDENCMLNRLGVVAGCLCCTVVLVDSLVAVWVMKQYGDRESWVRLRTVDHPFSASSIVSHNGEIVLFISSTVMVYSPTRNVFRILPEFDSCDGNARLHIESLVSPKPSITDDI